MLSIEILEFKIIDNFAKLPKFMNTKFKYSKIQKYKSSKNQEIKKSQKSKIFRNPKCPEIYISKNSRKFEMNFNILNPITTRNKKVSRRRFLLRHSFLNPWYITAIFHLFVQEISQQ